MGEISMIGLDIAKNVFHVHGVDASGAPVLRRQLFQMLNPLATTKCPFANLPSAKTGRWGEGITAEDMTTLTWVKPRVVVEIAFTEWTAGGSRRHCACVGVRTDKDAASVRREQ